MRKEAGYFLVYCLSVYLIQIPFSYMAVDHWCCLLGSWHSLNVLFPTAMWGMLTIKCMNKIKSHGVHVGLQRSKNQATKTCYKDDTLFLDLGMKYAVSATYLAYHHP